MQWCLCQNDAYILWMGSVQLWWNKPYIASTSTYRVDICKSLDVAMSVGILQRWLLIKSSLSLIKFFYLCSCHAAEYYMNECTKAVILTLTSLNWRLLDFLIPFCCRTGHESNIFFQCAGPQAQQLQRCHVAGMVAIGWCLQVCSFAETAIPEMPCAR